MFYSHRLMCRHSPALLMSNSSSLLTTPGKLMPLMHW
jgi:hypothetical protein